MSDKLLRMLVYVSQSDAPSFSLSDFFAAFWLYRYTVIDYEPAREWQYIDWPRDVPVARVSYLAQSIAHRSIDTFTFFGDGPGRTRVNYEFTLLLKGPLTHFTTPLFKPALWLLGVEAVK